MKLVITNLRDLSHSTKEFSEPLNSLSKTHKVSQEDIDRFLGRQLESIRAIVAQTPLGQRHCRISAAPQKAMAARCHEI
jgi:hypothetical protein